MDREIDLASKKFTINPYILALFFGGLLVFTIGIGLILFKPQSEPDVQIISSKGLVAGDSSYAKTSEDGKILVHVDGAVVRPAVYKLSGDARVDDAIKAAGGMTSDADTARVNLAAKLVDGQKIYVASQSQSESQSVGQATNQSQTGLISINSGSQVELESLPGVGPVTAQKIISNRPYGSVEELLSKKVVSSSVYQKVKDLVGL